jgi:hypothetical protein
MRQARAAKPRPQLEAVLQLFFVIFVVVGGVFHDDGVIACVDFSPLFLLGLPLLRDLDSARRWLWLGDELLQVLLQDTRCQQLYTRQ